MNKISLIILCLISTFVNSQGRQIILVDSLTKEHIQYANISFLNKNNGTYSNINGIFTLPKSLSLVDSIEVSYLGYHSRKFKIKKLKDSIFLSPKEERLDEIIIKNISHKKKYIGYKKRGDLSWALSSNIELAVLVKPIKKCILNKISIPINKTVIKKIDRRYKKIKPNFNTIMKLLIYSSKDNLPDKILFKKPIFIELNQDSDDTILIDLSDKLIELNEKGVFISLSKIENSNQEYNYLPMLRYTKKKSKTVSSISFYKAIFVDNKWIPINELHKQNGTNKDYNLALKLEVLEYE